MKYIAVLLAAAGLAAAQSLSDIPACALPCINSAVQNATSCSVSDYKCVCDHENAVVAAATACTLQACGADVATGQVLPATQKFCSAVEAGSSVSGSASATASASASASASGSASGSASAASTSSAAATTSSAASSSAEASSSSAAAASTSAAATTTMASMTTGGSSSAAASSPSSVATAGAAVMGSVGGLAMLALGALAAF